MADKVPFKDIPVPPKVALPEGSKPDAPETAVTIPQMKSPTNENAPGLKRRDSITSNPFQTIPPTRRGSSNIRPRLTDSAGFMKCCFVISHPNSVVLLFLTWAITHFVICAKMFPILREDGLMHTASFMMYLYLSLSHGIVGTGSAAGFLVVLLSKSLRPVKILRILMGFFHPLWCLINAILWTYWVLKYKDEKALGTPNWFGSGRIPNQDLNVGIQVLNVSGAWFGTVFAIYGSFVLWSYYRYLRLVSNIFPAPKIGGGSRRGSITATASV